MAYRNSPLMIVTLDDDLEPDYKGHLSQFYAALFDYKPVQRLDYFSTMTDPKIMPRGYIKGETEIKIAHGCWTNVPDFDAHTQLTCDSDGVTRSEFYQGVIPKGAFFSMCGMNLAWKPEMTKWMYFPLMGKYNGYEIDRSGDIFAGYYVKKICDQNNWGITSGSPFCHHTRASNPWENLIKEEKFWEYQTMFLHKVIFMDEDNWDISFIKQLASYKPEQDKIIQYMKKTGEAYKIWGDLVDGYK
jgi:reversibly glycosylated polypeptide/UDP-arabinopyranose mutase